MRLGRRIRTPSLREQRRKARIDRLALLVALVGAVVLLLSQLSMMAQLLIREVHITGNEALTTDVLFAAVAPHLQGYYGGLFARKNILLYPQRDIEVTLEGKFPRIKIVEVEFENLNTISIAVEERAAIGHYCVTTAPSTLQIEIEEACYLLDEDGFLFAEAPHITGSSVFTYRSDIATSTKGVRDSFLTPEAFRALRDFIGTMKRFGLSGTALFVETPNRYVLTLFEGGTIIFDPADGYENILENLNIVLQSKEFKTRTEDGRLLEIEYIDLRFGNKIFYRLEHDTNPQIEDE